MLDIKAYGYEGDKNHKDGLVPGRITELHRDMYKVICEHGEVSAQLTGAFYHSAAAREDFPSVGDYVLLRYNESGSSGIAELLPRKSKFSRTDYSGHVAGYVKNILEQVVAANFDYVFIMSSLNRDFNISRILRYLTAARQSGGKPVIILTKADLTDDFAPQVETVRAAAPDTPVHALSSYTGFGLDALGEYLRPGVTAVFLGSSGVGKSSLLNALAGNELMDTGGIREDDSRGRHTTTHRQLFMLSSGALIIDTPGMRELGLWNAEEGISATFSGLEELFARCKFSDCTHKAEPGCAVLAALEDGSLSQSQWAAYLDQKREAVFVESKSTYLKGKKEWQKSISKFSRDMKKSGGKRRADDREW